MNVIRKMSPHAAILIANMYYVFFGIDRVNTAMNFINNGYTKFLLLVMLACCVLITMDLLARHNRSRGDGRDMQRLIFIGAGALLNAALAIILLTDAILGNRGMPFLSEPVKIVTLLACIANWANGFRMIGAVRADLRAEQARRAAARRNAQRRPAQRPQTSRSRYDDSYGARSRYADGVRRYESDRYADSRQAATPARTASAGAAGTKAMPALPDMRKIPATAAAPVTARKAARAVRDTGTATAAPPGIQKAAIPASAAVLPDIAKATIPEKAAVPPAMRDPAGAPAMRRMATAVPPVTAAVMTVPQTAAVPAATTAKWAASPAALPAIPKESPLAGLPAIRTNIDIQKEVVCDRTKRLSDIRIRVCGRRFLIFVQNALQRNGLCVRR